MKNKKKNGGVRGINKKVLVLDQSYQPLTLTSLKKCMTLYFREKVDIVETHATEVISSVSSSIPRPLVIRLRTKVKYNPYKFVMLNRQNIMRRDGYACAYCGSTHNLTIDHIMPKSRGGKDVWENLVTACGTCNFLKDSMTPEEWGKALRVRPRHPSHLSFLIADIHESPEQWRPYLYMT